MLTRDWPINRVFYQGFLSARHASREMKREKTNARRHRAYEFAGGEKK
jgi:hypothetical protein